MAYVKKIWKAYPDTTTPILASDMNNIENGLAGILDWIYPVGTIYETTSTNLDTTTKMANHFGGTWEVYGSGRVLVAKSADTEFDTLGETGGAKTHILTIDETPSHSHNLRIKQNASGFGDGYLTNASGYDYTAGTGAIEKTGGDQPHNNLQPYIVVYRYRRVS